MAGCLEHVSKNKVFRTFQNLGGFDMYLKKILILMMFILVSTMAFAGQCYVGGDCYVQHVVVDTEYDQIQVNITSAVNLSYSDVGNMTLNPSSNGSVYYYLTNFNVEGNYTAFVQVFNDSVEQSNDTQTFIVLGASSLRYNSCPTSGAGQTAMWGFVVFALILVIFAYGAQMKVVGAIGGLMMAASYFYVVGCSQLLAALLGLIGVAFTAYFLTADL